MFAVITSVCRVFKMGKTIIIRCRYMTYLSLYQTFQRAVAANNTIQAYSRLYEDSKMMMSLILIWRDSNTTYQGKPNVEIFDFLSDL